MFAALLSLLVAALLLVPAAWFLFAFIRYMVSGEYDIDQRLHEILD